MEKKNFWLLTDVEKRAAIGEAIKLCFGEHALLHGFSINFANTNGFIIIGYYGAILKESELNLFNGYLKVLDTHSSFNIRIKQDDGNIYYSSIMYVFKRNRL